MCTHTHTYWPYIHTQAWTHKHTYNTLTYILMHIHHPHAYAKIKFKALWQRDTLLLCVIGMGTHTTVCVGQRLTQWSPSSSYLLSWASGLKLGLQACMAKCPYPLSHLTPPRVIFWYRVSLCSYKLSPLSWNWQVSFLSAPNAGIRDEDHLSWWKPLLYSISDIKIMCFSPTNNQYFNGCPTIWS